MIFDKQLIPSNLEEYNKLYKYSVDNPDNLKRYEELILNVINQDVEIYSLFKVK